MCHDDYTKLLCKALLEHDPTAAMHAISMGADVNAKGEDGWCLLCYPVMSDQHRQLLRAFLDAGARPNTFEHDDPLYWAASCQRAEAVQALVDAGGRVAWYEPPSPTTALHEASCKGDEAIVRILLSANGREFLNEFDYLLCTPLGRAVRKHRARIARMLIDAGADVNAKHAQLPSDPALKIAVEEGDEELVEMLLAAGADPTIPGWMGVTALCVARDRAHTASGRRIAEMIETPMRNRT